MNDAREIRLASRPAGLPVAADFAMVRVQVPDPTGGQVLVRNRYLAMAAVMGMLARGVDVGMPLGVYRVGEPLFGSALGEVVAAGPDAKLSPGDLVVHPYGWRELALGPGERFRKVDPERLPEPELYLGQGLTAYAGLVAAGRLEPGDTVFVSGAAGGVGSLAVQIARLKGAGRVVGCAGTPAKVELLRHLGVDAAFDYHDGPVVRRLREAAPDGIDVAFDNVGGEHLAAAVEVARPGARIVLCGALGGPAPVPLEAMAVIGKRLSLLGFQVNRHRDLEPRWLADFAGWLRAGAVEVPRHVAHGLEAAPDALIGLLRGDHAGLTLVRLA